MKSIKLTAVLGIGLCAAVLLNAQQTSAAPIEPVTSGKVRFETPTGPDEDGPFNLIKPGTYDEWITIKENEGKAAGSGTFHISFVPNFDFGTVKVSTTDKYHNLNQEISYQSYEDEEPYNENDSRTVDHIAPFAQVVNMESDEEFQLTVSASKFVSGTHTLENTRIQIRDFELRNNLLDRTTPDNGTAAADILKAVGDGTTHIDLTSTPLPILTTKEGKGKETNGSSSSVVFHKGYKNTESYPKAVLKNDDSVRLFVPASDAPRVGVDYTSTITWSLDNTP